MGNGLKIRLEVDPIAVLDSSFYLPEDLKEYMSDYGITSLAETHNLDGPSISLNYWYSATDLNLGGVWAEQWSSFVKGLSHGGIKIGNHEDSLLWIFDKKIWNGLCQKAYELIVSKHLPLLKDGILSMVWGFNIPQNLNCFTWLDVNRKISTWDNLYKRVWFGPNRCSLCKIEAETVDHIFVGCSFVQKVIHSLGSMFDVHMHWSNTSLLEKISIGLQRVEGFCIFPSYLFGIYGRPRIAVFFKTRNQISPDFVM